MFFRGIKQGNSSLLEAANIFVESGSFLLI